MVIENGNWKIEKTESKISAASASLAVGWVGSSGSAGGPTPLAPPQAGQVGEFLISDFNNQFPISKYEFLICFHDPGGEVFLLFQDLSKLEGLFP